MEFKATTKNKSNFESKCSNDSKIHLMPTQYIIFSTTIIFNAWFLKWQYNTSFKPLKNYFYWKIITILPELQSMYTPSDNYIPLSIISSVSFCQGTRIKIVRVWFGFTMRMQFLDPTRSFNFCSFLHCIIFNWK